MSKSITKHKLETTYDDTGRQIHQDKWVNVNIAESAGGWRKYYMSGLDLYDVCVSKLENHMLRYMIEQTKKGFILNMRNDKLIKVFNISDRKAKTFIKKMKDAEFIRGGAGVYITNPFMFIPYGTTDKDIASAQEDWVNQT